MNKKKRGKGTKTTTLNRKNRDFQVKKKIQLSLTTDAWHC